MDIYAAKFCKDCKHADDSRGDGTLRCKSPNNFIPHVDQAAFYVTGEQQPTKLAIRGGSCHSLRVERDPETDSLVCGPTGKWFELRAV